MNNNIEEDHVSFEVAKLLKEKEFGLSENCYIQLYSYYDGEGALQNKPEVYVSKKYNKLDTHLGADIIDDFEAHISYLDNSLDGIYLAPTHALAIKWIRENFGIHIKIDWFLTEENSVDWDYSIQKIGVDIDEKGNSQYLRDYDPESGFSSTEEAVSAALLYTLTKLI